MDTYISDKSVNALVRELFGVEIGEATPEQIPALDEATEAYFNAEGGCPKVYSSCVKVIEKLGSEMGKGKKVLDLGCGTGNDAPAFITAGFDYTGIDRAEIPIITARKYAPKGRFIKMDMRQMTFEDDSFDCLWVHGVFGYIPPEEVLSVMKKMGRILRPGGLAFISAPVLCNSGSHRVFQWKDVRSVFRKPILGVKWSLPVFTDYLYRSGIEVKTTFEVKDGLFLIGRSRK
ncbi:MAG: class I SAM-dependent methyltransferase [Candidatus Taylorbacteria bacterium]